MAGITTSLLLAGAAAGGLASTIGGAMGKMKDKIQPPALPQAPNPNDAALKAQDMANKKRASSSKTIYTSPLGISGTAQVARKTLTGV